MAKLRRIPNIENSVVVDNGAVMHAWRRPKCASIALTDCYRFDVGEVKTVSGVCGIVVAQWRMLGSKRTELCRCFDMLFNLYFGTFTTCKAPGVFGEGPSSTRRQRIVRSAILKNLQVLPYPPESSIPWNQHPEWFVVFKRGMQIHRIVCPQLVALLLLLCRAFSQPVHTSATRCILGE